MKVLGIEPTPNPMAMKFLLDRCVLKEGSLHFDSPLEAAGDRIAEPLFNLEGIQSVFIMNDFVTLTVDASPDWLKIRKEVEALVDTFPDTFYCSERRAAQAAENFEGQLTDLKSEIERLIDDYIRPALASDGGGIEVVRLDGDNLVVRYQGACGTCPTAISGTLMYIQSLLRTELARPINVVPV